MSFVVKKRDLTDPEQLQALIVEHVDDLERGLTILDSRLLLGQVAIDVVAVDAEGALVLMALGLVADEEMFLKAVDAYSWCLEYPEAIRRLYPNVQFSAAHPPRVMFVVERMPDAFHRKIKQLGFAEIDCIEFRHLDVDGTAAVYFDSLARLRRAPAAAAEQNGTASPVASGRPTSLKLQKLLGADRSVANREPAAPVVRIVHRAPPREEPKPAASASRPERVVAPRQTADTGRDRASTVEPPAAVIPPPAAVVPPAAASVDVAAFASFTEAVAGAAALPEAMVESFVSSEAPTTNGHVAAASIAATRRPAPAAVATAPAAVPAQPSAPEPLVSREIPVAVDTASAEPECVVTPITAFEPAPTVADIVVPKPELVIDEPAIISTPSAPEAPPTMIASADVPEVDVVAASLTASEPPTSLVPSTAEPELVVTPVLELETPSAVEPEPEAEAVVASLPELIPVAAEPLVQALALDPVATAITNDPEPELAELSTESVPSVEPIAPVITSVPSVFSRRAPESAAAAKTEPKVSFAGASKDLLPPVSRPPQIEPPVSIERPSVEEITRATIDDLVGATEKPTAFTKPSGAFAKRPRTIAPPPSEGPPIAAGPKLGGAVKRNGAPPPVPEPAAPAEGDAPPAMPEGFEGLQFPNDGVLTRQWMEFLNQMAAGK